MEQVLDVPRSNITAPLRTKQIRAGVIIFAAALAGTVLIRTVGIESSLRYLMFLPFLAAFHALAMGLTGVCGISAAWAVRQTEDGAEPVIDRNELRMVRLRGARVIATTMLSAVAATITLIR